MSSPAGTEVDRRRVSAFGNREGRLRRGVARPEDLERRRHPGAQGRSGADPHRPARRPRGSRGALYRGRRQRHRRHRHLSAERQSAAGTEIRLQARLVQAAADARRQIHQAGNSRSAGRRLQRRARAARYLSDQIMGQGCADPAEEPRGVQIADRSGLVAMRSAPCIRPSRCTRSGTTSAIAGHAMPASGSIICC